VDKLQGQVGKFIKLPQLYHLSALAKGLTPQDCESFLLTKERYALWQEMHTARGAQDVLPLDGVCLSGPNGVGKSSVLHMLASLAHVNNWIVLYIPRALQWAVVEMGQDGKPSAEPAATYFLEKFVELNEVYAEELERLQPALWNVIEAALKGETTATTVQRNLMRTLRKQDKYSVLYAFDEHQVLFPKAGEDPALAPLSMRPDYFRTFTSWQGETAGLRTYTIYAGSAHSKFEQNLPSGEQGRLRFIRPWSRKDLEMATRTPNTALYLPGIVKKTHEGTAEEVNVALDAYLEEVTGRVPRLLRYVKDSAEFRKRRQTTRYSDDDDGDDEAILKKAIADVETEAIRFGIDEVKRTYYSLPEIDKKSFVTYLGRILFPAWYGGLPTTRDAQLYDKGFIYHDLDKLRVINRPARRVLQTLYAQQMAVENRVKLYEREAGHVFERLVLRGTLENNAANIMGVYYKAKESSRTARIGLDLYAQDVIPLVKSRNGNYHFSQDTAPHYLRMEDGSIMIVPEDARFPAWDFIHYAVKHKENVTRRVVSFVQVTVSQGKQLQSGIWTADPNHPAKMQNETARDGVVGQVLDLLELECTDLGYDKTSHRFVAAPKNPNDRVQFILLTAAPAPISSSSASRGKPYHHHKTKFDMQNLVVVFRDQVEAKLGIVFEGEAYDKEEEEEAPLQAEQEKRATKGSGGKLEKGRQKKTANKKEVCPWHIQPTDKCLAGINTYKYATKQRGSSTVILSGGDPQVEK
jgi:hypothetical protein